VDALHRRHGDSAFLHPKAPYGNPDKVPVHILVFHQVMQNIQGADYLAFMLFYDLRRVADMVEGVMGQKQKVHLVQIVCLDGTIGIVVDKRIDDHMDPAGCFQTIPGDPEKL
jgi:hypothetical protein